jgi:hypothetical protein
LLLLLCCLLPQAIPPWYFSRTNGDPHRSGFHVSNCSSLLSVLRRISQVQRSF